MENTNVCESSERVEEVTKLHPWYLVWSVRNHIWEFRDLLPAVSDRIAVYNEVGAVLNGVGLTETFEAKLAFTADGKRIIACK